MPTVYNTAKMQRGKANVETSGAILVDENDVIEETDEKLRIREEIDRKINAMNHLFLDLDESDIELAQDAIESDSDEDDFVFIPRDIHNLPYPMTSKIEPQSEDENDCSVLDKQAPMSIEMELIAQNDANRDETNAIQNNPDTVPSVVPSTTIETEADKPNPMPSEMEPITQNDANLQNEMNTTNKNNIHTVPFGGPYMTTETDADIPNTILSENEPIVRIDINLESETIPNKTDLVSVSSDELNTATQSKMQSNIPDIVSVPFGSMSNNAHSVQSESNQGSTMGNFVHLRSVMHLHFPGPYQMVFINITESPKCIANYYTYNFFIYSHIDQR